MELPPLLTSSLSHPLYPGVWNQSSPSHTNRTRRARFSQKSYFQDDSGLWTRLNLPKCQHLAEQIAEGQIHFVYLDAAQLLKHALGVRRVEGKLLLLWYDVDAPEGRAYEEEIREVRRLG